MGKSKVFAAAGPTGASAILLPLRVFAALAIAAIVSAAAAGAAGEAAESAFFAEASRPMSLTPFAALFGDVMKDAFGAWGVWLPLAVAFKFFLDGAALSAFTNAARGAPGRPLAGGWSWFWSMLRIALLSALLLIPGLAVLALVVLPGMDPTSLAPDESAYEAVVARPQLFVAGVLIWFWLVGAVALHAKAAAVAHRSKNTFVAFARGVSAVVTRPFSGALFYVVLTGAATGLGAYVVTSWRMADVGGGSWTLWALVWFAVVVAQAYAWHWLSRAAALDAVARIDRRAESAPAPEAAPAPA